MIRNEQAASDAFRRTPFGIADIAVLLGGLTLVAIFAKVGAGTLISFVPSRSVPHIDLDPRNLPYYAARSTLRMFVALSWSVAFTLVYGYAAARNRHAERVLIPVLDVLQSIPVLGFLSITVTGFIAFFPGRLLGLEMASVFAIFTAQAWNMAFAFYQSLRSIPTELKEAAQLYRLSGWQRFVQLDVPSSMIGLVWNAMMSFGGGWFFLAASEAISVLNQNYTLPGVGSYVAAAVVSKNLQALLLAAITIAVVIVVVDQLFWKPLVAWSDKFRMEQSASGAAPRSWVYDLLRASSLPSRLSWLWQPVADSIGTLLSAMTAFRSLHLSRNDSRLGDRTYDAILFLVVAVLLALALYFILSTVGVHEVLRVFALGLITFARVILLLILATMVWTPIGVALGLNPKIARSVQPLVQFLASFPANVLFPFATLVFIRWNVPINWGCVLLMALGAQWYILFNTIAGAQTIPTELREMTADLEVKGWLRWRRLIIPAIFSSWATGAITASGGAWNASIVSEIVTWGTATLTATGLGSYIAEATSKGDWPRVTLGISMMSIFVVTVNTLVWRRLYRYAEERFTL